MLVTRALAWYQTYGAVTYATVGSVSPRTRWRVPMRMKQVLITAVVALGVVIAYDTHKNKS